MSKIVLSKDDFKVFWEATVRYYELDPQGVMHNANHVAFFDQAITAYFKYVNYAYLKDIENTQKVENKNTQYANKLIVANL